MIQDSSGYYSLRVNFQIRMRRKRATLALALSPVALAAVVALGVGQTLSLILWLGAVALCGWAVFPLFALALPWAPDRGYGLARALGPVIVGWVAWGIASSGALGFHAGTVLLALCLLAAIGYVAWRNAGGFGALLRPLASRLVGVELLFLAAFLLFLFFRSLSPEIYWGEKPMDFTFLNYFVRLRSLPPEDPWAANHPMQYYYLGTLVLAALHKLSGVATGIGYNLSLATWAALLATAVYSITLAATRRVWLAWAGAVLVVLTSDLEVFRILYSGDKPFGFDAFWASSRVIVGAMANEYPFWTFLFGDLHAHLIALPLTVSLAGLAAPLLRPARGERELWASRVLFGLVLGLTFAVNAWDFIYYLVFSALLLAFRVSGTRSWRGARTLVVEALLVGGAAAVTFLPTWVQLGGSGQGHGLVEGSGDSVGQELRFLGHFLLPLLFGAALFARRRLATVLRAGRTRLTICFLLALTPAFGAYFGRFFGMRAPFDLMLLATVLSSLGALLASSPALFERQAGLYTLTAGWLIALMEMVWVADRMNFLFKGYLVVWCLLGLALAVLLRPLLRLRTARSRWLRTGVWSGVALAGLALVASLLNAIMFCGFHRVDGPRPTLDGTAYLQKQDREEKALVDWMQGNLSGTPHVLEAHGNPYGPYTRVSMNTGLPTVLGWEHHVKQRGLSPDEVERRKLDIAEIYGASTPLEAYRLLRRYGAELIVVGELERQTYPGPGPSKFSAANAYFRELYRTGKTALYAVRGSALYPFKGER